MSLIEQTGSPGVSDLVVFVGSTRKETRMRAFKIVVERDLDTSLYVGCVPGWPGAHSQGDTVDDLTRNIHEVLEMLLVSCL